MYTSNRVTVIRSALDTLSWIPHNPLAYYCLYSFIANSETTSVSLAFQHFQEDPKEKLEIL